MEKYKKDCNRLMEEGERLRLSFLSKIYGDDFKEAIKQNFDGDIQKTEKYIKDLPDFKHSYQAWYSESLRLIKQLLPDRYQDFIRLYEKPKNRKEVTFESYRIEDALQGLQTKRGIDVIASAESAFPHLEQQIAILSAVQNRFESSLFDIKQLVQADLFDSEIEAARELLKNGFSRGAGAISGVVLEKHLSQVCENHNISIKKKHPTISDFNDKLKQADVIDVPQWRFHQHLADIRNLCGHNKKSEPSTDQVEDLIDGVEKVTKTLY
ncbi:MULTISPECIES: hypothetical protein [unclassified Guyparkeria]|uniref:hypothetical protein n=1 Tax=unclassified Guyparkeria TaxID=2626246 RepID=UPI0018D21F4E|nr:MULTISPECIES: hypothetical protein [unclassified Guyparkeria]